MEGKGGKGLLVDGLMRWLGLGSTVNSSRPRLLDLLNHTEKPPFILNTTVFYCSCFFQRR